MGARRDMEHYDFDWDEAPAPPRAPGDPPAWRSNPLLVFLVRNLGMLVFGPFLVFSVLLAPRGAFLAMRPMWFVGLSAGVAVFVMLRPRSHSGEKPKVSPANYWSGGLVGTMFATLMSHAGPDVKAFGTGVVAVVFAWLIWLLDWNRRSPTAGRTKVSS